MNQCCNTGAPPKDLALSSLCTGKLAGCDAQIQRANVGVLTATTAVLGHATIDSLQLPSIPGSVTYFANQSAVGGNSIILSIAEISQLFDAENGILSTWPDLFVGGSTSYSPSTGLDYVPTTATIGTYIQWDGVFVPTSGTYSLRSIMAYFPNNGQYTVFVDGVSTGSTVDLSTSSNITIAQWTNISLSAGLHSIRLQNTAPGAMGFNNFTTTEQPFVLVQVV